MQAGQEGLKLSSATHLRYVNGLRDELVMSVSMACRHARRGESSQTSSTAGLVVLIVLSRHAVHGTVRSTASCNDASASASRAPVLGPASNNVRP